MLTGVKLGAAIAAAIKKKKVTQRDVAAHFGVKPPSIQDWIKRGTIGKARLPELWAYFADVVGPEHWGLKQFPGGGSIELVQLGTYAAEDADLVSIPQFDTGGAMGDGLLLRDQPGVIRGWAVNHEWVNKNLKNHTGAKNLCIVTGFGDSMKGMYNSGDPLVVDRGVKKVEYDAVYFFRVGDEGFIKRLQRIPGEGLVAISENKAYRDWTIRPDMDFEVFGRVLKAWKGEDF